MAAAARYGLGQTQEPETIEVSLVGVRGLSNEAIICCLLRSINRNLHWKWGAETQTSGAAWGCQCHKWWLHVLRPMLAPWLSFLHQHMPILTPESILS